jgi:hypothetical protein
MLHEVRTSCFDSCRGPPVGGRLREGRWLVLLSGRRKWGGFDVSTPSGPPREGTGACPTVGQEGARGRSSRRPLGGAQRRPDARGGVGLLQTSGAPYGPRSARKGHSRREGPPPPAPLVDHPYTSRCGRAGAYRLVVGTTVWLPGAASAAERVVYHLGRGQNVKRLCVNHRMGSGPFPLAPAFSKEGGIPWAARPGERDEGRFPVSSPQSTPSPRAAPGGRSLLGIGPALVPRARVAPGVAEAEGRASGPVRQGNLRQALASRPR